MRFVKVHANKFNVPFGKSPEKVELIINSDFIKAIINNNVFTTEGESGLEITIAGQRYASLQFIGFVV